MTTKTLEQPRVDPRVTRTQNLIRDAFKSLLSEKSFESTSVQDIAERATVNRATFYAHFQDKYALLDTVIRDAIRQYLSEGDPMASDVRSLLSGVGKSVFAFVAAHRKCKVDREFEPQFERAMEAEVGEFLAPRFSACAAHVIAAAMVASAMRWRAGGCKEPADKLLREIVDVLSDGVAKT